MTARERMLRAVAETYPFDSDQEYADDESEIPLAAFDGNGELYQFVLVQSYHNGRTWHAFADTVAELMEYQEGEEDPWTPVLVADLDTGQTANVHLSARIDEFGKGPYTFESKYEIWWDDNGCWAETLLPHQAPGQGTLLGPFDSESEAERAVSEEAEDA